MFLALEVFVFSAFGARPVSTTAARAPGVRPLGSYLNKVSFLFPWCFRSWLLRLLPFFPLSP